jgi:hypothetical protein
LCGKAQEAKDRSSIGSSVISVTFAFNQNPRIHSLSSNGKLQPGKSIINPNDNYSPSTTYSVAIKPKSNPEAHNIDTWPLLTGTPKAANMAVKQKTTAKPNQSASALDTASQSASSNSLSTVSSSSGSVRKATMFTVPTPSLWPTPAAAAAAAAAAAIAQAPPASTSFEQAQMSADRVPFMSALSSAFSSFGDDWCSKTITPALNGGLQASTSIPVGTPSAPATLSPLVTDPIWVSSASAALMRADAVNGSESNDNNDNATATTKKNDVHRMSIPMRGLKLEYAKRMDRSTYAGSIYKGLNSDLSIQFGTESIDVSAPEMKALTQVCLKINSMFEKWQEAIWTVRCELDVGPQLKRHVQRLLQNATPPINVIHNCTCTPSSISCDSKTNEKNDNAALIKLGGAALFTIKLGGLSEADIERAKTLVSAEIIPTCKYISVQGYDRIQTSRVIVFAINAGLLNIPEIQSDYDVIIRYT